MATILKNRGPVARKSGSGRILRGYDVVEYENGCAVYQYTGILVGNVMKLYPHRAMVYGTKRDKREVSAREILRDF